LFEEAVECSVCACGLFERAWDLVVYSERMSVCEDQGIECSCPGIPITSLVGVYADKIQNI
jgi:hypothetical protein